MDLDTKSRLLALVYNWLLPITVVFSLEVVGYILYTRYRTRQIQVAASGAHAPSKPDKPKADSWPRSLRLRSECSTDLNSDADYLTSRQGSGEVSAMNQDVLTHRSCSIPSRVAGLALDGVVLRRSTAPPTANRQGLPLDLSDCSPPRSYTPSVSDEFPKASYTYTLRDLLQMLCSMRRGGYFESKHDAPEECASGSSNANGAVTQGNIVATSGPTDAVLPLSDIRLPSRIQNTEPLLNRPSGASWDSAAVQRRAQIPGQNPADCVHSDEVQCSSTDMEKREEAANTEARPLLYKALKFRQFDIASTIYLGFKHECMAIRPETFILLIQVALSSKAFGTCAEWLVELLKQNDVDAEWLDRVIAALSVGAPLVLKALLAQLEELRKSDLLSSACSAVVAHASSYLALASSQAAGGVSAESTCKPESSRHPPTASPAPVLHPSGLSLRPGNRVVPNSGKLVQAEQRAALRSFAENTPSSKGLNPNAPEFVPVGPALAEHAQDDLQQTVLAHQQLQQNILLLLQQSGSGDIASKASENNSSPLRLEVPTQEASSLPTKQLQVMTQIQQLEEAKSTEQGALESADNDRASKLRDAGALDSQQQEAAQAPVAVQQPEQHQDKQRSDTEPEQQGVKSQLTLQQQLQQHLERALLQHGAPPGLPPPRRHLKNLRQTESPARVRSESCRSPTHAKDDEVASRQRIADALLSRIASRSKTIA